SNLGSLPDCFAREARATSLPTLPSCSTSVSSRHRPAASETCPLTSGIAHQLVDDGPDALARSRILHPTRAVPVAWSDVDHRVVFNPRSRPPFGREEVDPPQPPLRRPTRDKKSLLVAVEIAPNRHDTEPDIHHCLDQVAEASLGEIAEVPNGHDVAHELALL